MTTGSTRDGLRTLFAGVDLDGDGRTDLVGFTMLLERLGLAWSRQETQARFEEADTNRDGLISFAEFEVLIATYGWATGTAQT